MVVLASKYTDSGATPGALRVAAALSEIAPDTTGVVAEHAVGIPTGVTLLEAADGLPVPIALVAFTVNVYAVPLLNPVTVIGDVAPELVKFPGLEVTV